MRSRHSSENEALRTDPQLLEIWKKFSFLPFGSDARLLNQISGLKLSSQCRKSPELAGASCDKICVVYRILSYDAGKVFCVKQHIIWMVT